MLPFRRRRKAAPLALLATYTRPSFLQRHRRKLMTMLIGFALFYGLAFGITTTYFLLQLTIPLIILAAAVVWLLPESEAAPVGLLSKLLFAFLIVLLLWPDYLALALPGLPWITAVRLVSVPLAFVLFVCLSVSPDLRAQMTDVLNATPWMWKLMTAFGIIATLSVVFSADPTFSFNKLIVAATNWFLIFFVSAYVFRTPGRVFRLAYLLWGIAIAVSLIGLQEWRHSSVPWAGHVPSFLAVQDDSVQRILSGAARAGSGKYRVQSKFTTSLGLAEYYALIMPFIVHFMFTASRWPVRIAAAIMVPCLFKMIVFTDSRLGMVGFFFSFLLYLLVWGYWRWRRDSDSLFGPAVVLSYPVVFTTFITASFYVGRLHAIIWGSGAQQASTDSRKLQFAMGLPKVLSHPWGYGIGRAGEVLGFANGAGVLTIDTYYLAVALEFGVIGFVVYYAIFINAIWNASKRLHSAMTPEHMLIAPIAISLVNFFVIKSIFSQQENHPLVFALLGALTALCWQIDRASSSAGAVAASGAAMARQKARRTGRAFADAQPATS